MPLWLILLVVVGACYGFFVLFALVASNGMLFAAQPTSYSSLPGQFNVPADDGTPIAAIHLPNPSARFTILYFHGNAEDLGDIHEVLVRLHARGFAVASMDYRSYGVTPGIPTEANTHADAAAFFRHVVEKLGVPRERIILYGRSLGSGPATELAVREPVAGLVIQSGFISAFRTMTGIALLPFDRFSNLAKIPRVRCPILVMHGDADRTVPYGHGQQLFAAATGTKRSLWVSGAAHNNFIDVAGDRYWAAMTEFRELLEQGPSGTP